MGIEMKKLDTRGRQITTLLGIPNGLEDVMVLIDNRDMQLVEFIVDAGFVFAFDTLQGGGGQLLALGELRLGDGTSLNVLLLNFFQELLLGLRESLLQLFGGHGGLGGFLQHLKIGFKLQKLFRGFLVFGNGFESDFCGGFSDFDLLRGSKHCQKCNLYELFWKNEV
jgi:hypothetical protein